MKKCRWEGNFRGLHSKNNCGRGKNKHFSIIPQSKLLSRGFFRIKVFVGVKKKFVVGGSQDHKQTFENVLGSRKWA